MAEEITPIGAAVLGLLMERNMHPYEMYQTLIERREDRLMKIRPGSLYHAVDRLLGQGLIEQQGVEREGNRPERTNYSIKPGGYQALRQHLSGLLREVVVEYPAFRQGVAEAHNLPKDEVIELLGERKAKLKAEIEELTETCAKFTAQELNRALWLDFGYQLNILQAQMSWISRTLIELENGELPWTHYSRLMAKHPQLTIDKITKEL
ncbi:PadR family transcriptional regulator [Psychromicrobium sp. YIM B11713]|uniref:PadR family transcriptional regulator n=1 Tax=Psychromicrobium sp. YIM B11713 TaxID=3145233 RepID=UPI00374F86DC